MWRERKTNKLFEMDVQAMKKDDYNIKSCRMPVVAETNEAYLYKHGWQDDGVSYVLCDRKYLTEQK